MINDLIKFYKNNTNNDFMQKDVNQLAYNCKNDIDYNKSYSALYIKTYKLMLYRFKKYKYIDTDILIDYMNEALDAAIKYFDNNRNVLFTTYLYKCCDWKIERLRRYYKKSRHHNTNIDNIDTVKFNTIDLSMDMIIDNLNIDNRKKILLKMLLKGYNRFEIQSQLNISKSMFYNIKSDISKQLNMDDFIIEY